MIIYIFVIPLLNKDWKHLYSEEMYITDIVRLSMA